MYGDNANHEKGITKAGIGLAGYYTNPMFSKAV